jgi:hypothetical protein
MDLTVTQHHLFNPVVVESGAYVANDQGAAQQTHHKASTQ